MRALPSLEHGYGGNRADIISGRTAIYGKTEINISFNPRINVHKPVTKRSQIDKFSVETRQDRLEKQLQRCKSRKIVLFDIETMTETIFDTTQALADSIGVLRKRINDSTSDKRVIRGRYVAWYLEKPITKEELAEILTRPIITKNKPMKVKCYDFEKKLLSIYSNINEIVEEYSCSSLVLTASLADGSMCYDKLLLFSSNTDDKEIMKKIKSLQG